MKNAKKVLAVHASDADQHLGHFKKILESLKEEECIESYTTLDSNDVTESTFKTLGNDDMVVVLLTSSMADSKASLESSLLDVKKQHPDMKVAEILIDNVPYETSFIAFPTSLEPIRSSENMDSVWQGISENLKNLFPKPVIEQVPTPITPTKPSNEKPAWKKFLPYILGVVALLILSFFLFRNCSQKPAVIAEPEKVEVIPENKDEKPIAEILDVSIITKTESSKKCPETIRGRAIIKTIGIDKLKGRWLRSDSTFESFERNINQDEQVELTTNWKFGEPGKKYNEEWLQLELLEPVPILSEKVFFNLKCPSDFTAVFIVDDVFSITGRGTVATGKVSKGTIKKGDQVYINNQGNPIICTGIEKFRQIIGSASAGENVGILLRGISKSDVKKGDKLVIR